MSRTLVRVTLLTGLQNQIRVDSRAALFRSRVGQENNCALSNLRSRTVGRAVVAQAMNLWTTDLPSCRMQRKRDGDKLSGDWSGPSGKARSVTGTWRNGYIELSFDAELGNPANPIIAPAIMAGWIDGDAGSGRMRVVDRSDGS